MFDFLIGQVYIFVHCIDLSLSGTFAGIKDDAPSLGCKR